MTVIMSPGVQHLYVAKTKHLSPFDNFIQPQQFYQKEAFYLTDPSPHLTDGCLLQK